MFTYVTKELPELLNELYPALIDPRKKSIMGHSMGGCGALIIAAKLHSEYKSFSAIAPRVSPSNPGAVWAKKTYVQLFGEGNEKAQQENDPVELVKSGCKLPPGRVVIGTEDTMQLQPELFEAALS